MKKSFFNITSLRRLQWLLVVAWLCLFPAFNAHATATAPKEQLSEPSSAQVAPHTAPVQQIIGPPYVEEQPIKGVLHGDIAFLIAKSKAKHRAILDAAITLAGRQDVRAVAAKVATVRPLDPVGLAYAVYDVKVPLLDKAILPSGLAARVEVVLVPRYPVKGQNPLDYSVHMALNNLELVDLYSQSVKRENEVLAELIPLADKAISEPLQNEAQNIEAEREFSSRFIKLSDQLTAVEKYRAVLPQFKNGLWDDPEQVAKKMRDALEFDPKNTQMLNALGESLLMLGKAQEAVEYLTTSIRLHSDNPKTYHTRGAVYISLHLPTLAVDDFSAAIRLSPRTAAYFEARGAAYLSQSQYGPMCEDFYAACTLGKCENYQWALSRNYCKPPEATPTPVQPSLPQNFGQQAN